jgi:hypothetical protein
MENRIWFGQVHIVEWLRLGDMRTGRDLFDEVQPIGIASNPEIPVDFTRISTRAEFLQLLRKFEKSSARPAACRCCTSRPMEAPTALASPRRKTFRLPN